jgi:hypothetical protein
MSPSSRAAPDGPIPFNPISPLPVPATSVANCFFAVLIRASMTSSSSTSSPASCRRVSRATSPAGTSVSRARACRAVRAFVAPPGTSSTSSRCSRCSRCSRLIVSVRAAPSSSRRSASSRSATVRSSGRTWRSDRVRNAPTATECASVASVLRPCPVENTRVRADSFAGTSTTVSPSLSRRRRPAVARDAGPHPGSPRPPTPAAGTAGPRPAAAGNPRCRCRTGPPPTAARPR